MLLGAESIKKRPVAFKLNDKELINLMRRSNIYSKALYKINCDNLTKNEITNKIVNIYKHIRLKIKTKKKIIQSLPNLISSILKISNKNSIKFQKCLTIIDRNISNKIISKIKKSLNKKKHIFLLKLMKK